MNAVVLAGGFGSRLMPLTKDTPKPLLSIAGEPMMDYSVSQLYSYGISDIVFTLAFFPQKIMRWVLGYRDISPHFSIEETPLGTCGGVNQTKDLLSERFFVLSGDGISDIDLNKMLKTHVDTGAEITLAVTDALDQSLYGVVERDESGAVRSFIEKPAIKIQNGFINCGVYLINKSVLDLVGDGFFDFSNDLFPLMLQKGLKLSTYVHDGFWSDVGSIESYKLTDDYIKNNGAFYKKPVNYLRKDKKTQINLK